MKHKFGKSLANRMNTRVVFIQEPEEEPEIIEFSSDEEKENIKPKKRVVILKDNFPIKTIKQKEKTEEEKIETEKKYYARKTEVFLRRQTMGFKRKTEVNVKPLTKNEVLKKFIKEKKIGKLIGEGAYKKCFLLGLTDVLLEIEIFDKNDYSEEVLKEISIFNKYSFSEDNFFFPKINFCCASKQNITEKRNKNNFIYISMPRYMNAEDFAARYNFDIIELFSSICFCYFIFSTNFVHYDIKLNNFLIKKLYNSELKNKTYNSHILKIEKFTQNDFHNTFPFPIITDFGSSEKIGEEKFKTTTLENTPIDYFFFNKPDVSNKSDIFQLGLVLINLLGKKPYEELLEKVEPPKYFMKNIKKLIPKTIIEDKEDIPILSKTLYKYLVLFGEESLKNIKGEKINLPLVKFIKEAFFEKVERKRNIKNKEERKKLKEDFDKHSEHYNVFKPSSEGVFNTFKYDREGIDLLKNMLEANPTKRITPEEILSHQYFKYFIQKV
eukprot:snap_masked-scaffold_2-processed-gene-0.20-mRNA-1 protein AED:1.00 eAED:1.00 QI:0/-1/0/0/-1/1/1/0/495